MNEGLILRRLTETNRWLRDPRWQDDDHDLRGLRHGLFEYRPRPLEGIEPGGLYVLRGPRRVGKTVEVKRAIADLVSQGINPRRILHFACDELSRGDLHRLVRAGREALTVNVAEPRFWFLDEITSVPGWPAAIKNLRDGTAFADDCVVLTGSSARDLDDATKDLAGRRGPAHPSERILLPMAFRAFVSAIGLGDLPRRPAVAPRDLFEPGTAEVLHDLVPWLGDLATAWELYLLVGGFPKPSPISSARDTCSPTSSRRSGT